ncbi:3-hydroxyacyl-CoA dehydrogenase NAD-binding domain-containing protein [Luteimonas sp. S4-F44]|uniref:3-hydroxyacyl-CoA dehydrogenase NAD-binding domain-containing protein n=1 Tax=Luteimonas sp. S4-F44 TaxID=2925842 RepID=UPI001F5346D0|nr:3-hydroxyacyl-CoA dehydrogenase NAD-binding domain-containing protein [Luteimonas sp. S4-F44]UNK43610.1 3-hydroxyacyl-CoA dehydrogenase NAD-binding domain-containing protein [Luteimonas sp. S4-F44]
MPILTTRHDACVVLEFSSPPVNALGRELAEALARDIVNVGSEPGTRAIVLTGAGRLFCAGADVAELGRQPGPAAAIRALIETVEASPVPVVAAIHGLAYGGGLELALACHARVATPDARFAFPEVTLGLLPGAGGTQRTPRLTGVAAALSLLMDGKPIAADRALAIGLIDAIADGDLRLCAAGYARTLGEEWGRVRDRSVPLDGAKAAIASAREAAGRRRDGGAAAAIVDCVEAAIAHTFDAGLAFERRLFETLLADPASRGLRHVFLAERAAARLPAPLAGGAARPVGKVAVIGAGVMGSGITTALLAAGLPVALVDPEPAALERAISRVGEAFRRDEQKGRMSGEVVQARLAALATTTEIEAAVADADLVIEAVFEDMAVKREVFAVLDRAAKPGAILASNTSTLDVDALADGVRDPGRVLGLHFFSPANVMRLVEIVRGARTRPEVLGTAMAFVRRIGKVGVVAGVCDGFIGNRMFEELLRQAYFLLEAGALPQQVDRAMEDFGFAMGPFRVMDLAGQDIGWRIRQRRAIEQPERPYSVIPDRICELGRFGQKTGAGFYRYPDGRKAVVDPDIDALVIAYSREIGIERRTIADNEIVERCVLALVNEGARLLDEGIAWRAADIDVVWTAGYGFPATRGGPMFYAEQIGLSQVLASIERFAAGDHSWAWQPADLLRRLARTHRGFGDADD